VLAALMTRKIQESVEVHVWFHKENELTSGAANSIDASHNVQRVQQLRRLHGWDELDMVSLIVGLIVSSRRLLKDFDRQQFLVVCSSASYNTIQYSFTNDN